MKFFVLAALVAVAAAVPVEDTMDVKEAKAMFYKAFEEAEMGKLAEKQEMQIPHMYMADSADVAAAKPYLADSADVVAAKADFMKYFDAREKGIPATPGALEPVQYAAPVHYAAPALTYANPIYTTYAHNYVQPAYTYSNAWAHTAINPYYYAPATTYAANILPYVAPIAPIAPKPVVDTPEVAAAKPYLADSAAVAAAKPYLADSADVAAAKAEFFAKFAEVEAQ